MSQRTTHKEQTQYLYDNPSWLYNYVFAFFYGFDTAYTDPSVNDNYTYDARTSNSTNVLPIKSYTYNSFRQHSAQVFGNLNYEYDYFCSDMTVGSKIEYGRNYYWTSHSVAQSHTMPELGTGLDYFGARYYASDISVWLSVDPLASRYPNVSPYMYVLGNPQMVHVHH